MTEPHAGESRPDEPPSDLSPAVISFDGPTRLALTLRLAGYNDAQVAKLIARGVPQDASDERRAA